MIFKTIHSFKDYCVVTILALILLKQEQIKSIRKLESTEL